MMFLEFRAANSPCPPRSPSNSFKIIGPHEVTFVPTVRLRKSFSCNTYGFPRKCCKQKTYRRANSFSCNTYKKQGGGVWIILTSQLGSLGTTKDTSRIYLSFQPLARCPSRNPFVLIFMQIDGGVYYPTMDAS